MPALDITRHRSAATALIAVVGEIDLATVPALRAALRLPQAGNLILDLDAVTFISAGGLHCMLDAHGRLSTTGHSLVIIESPQVHRITTITGVHRTLLTAPTRSAAHALFGAGVDTSDPPSTVLSSGEAHGAI